MVHHRGREAREARAAILHPTAVYDPRCACCALLLSELIGDAGSDLRAEDPGFVYPNAHRVWFAVGTGACVANEQVGGTRAGRRPVAVDLTSDRRRRPVELSGDIRETALYGQPERDLLTLVLAQPCSWHPAHLRLIERNPGRSASRGVETTT
ncbi:MAG: hypothetical protein WD010_00520 [Nitriliruptor sp.]